jgi:RimJ/RimL family protein N-acetyltransferase
MELVEVRDKRELFAFLSQDAALHAYSIGDLDDFFFVNTRWFAARSTDVETRTIKAVFLLYTPDELPVLLALENRDKSSGRFLMESVLPLLPDKFYCHIGRYLTETVEANYRAEPNGDYYRMVLTRDNFKQVSLSGINHKFLTSDDLQVAGAFYSENFPDNWFDSRMLETGKYVALYSRDGSDAAMICISGIHVYSATYKIACLGNIVTHLDYRGTGLATYATSLLCADLLESVETIGLNVNIDNIAAVRCYQKLGFFIHDQFMETTYFKK